MAGDGNAKERETEGTTGSKEEKRNHGKELKNGVRVPYCESVLLAAI